MTTTLREGLMSVQEELAKLAADNATMPTAQARGSARGLQWAAERLSGLLAHHPAPPACDMKCNDVMDFAWCETHDTTFPLGAACKFDGRDAYEVAAEEADEQRGLKVRAEHERDLMAAELDPYRAEDLRQRRWASFCAESDVRCDDCGLRYGEREDYSCGEHGPHSYDEDELAQARKIEPSNNPHTAAWEAAQAATGVSSA